MKLDLPWITKEMQKQINHRNKIVKKRDINELFKLDNNSDFSIALQEILINDCIEKYNPTNLNHVEKTLFLCMFLEDAGQSGTILNFLQEQYADYTIEVIEALFEIGAIKSANIIKQAVELLPKDGTWFYKYADENTEKLMSKLNSEFSNYPDGYMRDLYRIYAEKHKEKLINPKLV